MKLVIPFFILFVAGGLFYYISQPDDETPLYNTDSSENVILIDVRTSDEYNDGHLSNSININFTEIADKIKQVTQDKEARIEVYCAVGSRAEIAKTILTYQGYKNVVNIGGYYELIKQRK